MKNLTLPAPLLHDAPIEEVKGQLNLVDAELEAQHHAMALLETEEASYRNAKREEARATGNLYPAFVAPDRVHRDRSARADFVMRLGARRDLLLSRIRAMGTRNPVIQAT